MIDTNGTSKAARKNIETEYWKQLDEREQDGTRTSELAGSPS